MIKEEKVLADMRTIMKIGNDAVLYTKLASFLNTLGGDALATDLRKSIADVARLVNIVGEED